VRWTFRALAGTGFAATPLTSLFARGRLRVAGAMRLSFPPAVDRSVGRARQAVADAWEGFDDVGLAEFAP
jgi:hypothetical protein